MVLKNNEIHTQTLTWCVGYVVSRSLNGLMKWFVVVHVTVEGYSTQFLDSASPRGFGSTPHKAKILKEKQNLNRVVFLIFECSKRNRLTWVWTVCQELWV